MFHMGSTYGGTILSFYREVVVSIRDPLFGESLCLKDVESMLHIMIAIEKSYLCE